MRRDYEETKKRYEENRKIEMERVCIRVTPEEKKLLEEKSKFCNLSKTEYLRKVIRENVIIIENNQEKMNYLYELNKIGVNINQIARVVNENGNIDDEDMQNVLKYMREIKKNVSDYFETK